MAIYLGGDPDSTGYCPTLDHSDRLKKSYPSNWQSIESDLLQVLHALDDPNTSEENLKQTLDEAMESHLKNKFYWLKPTVIQKILNYYSYLNR